MDGFIKNQPCGSFDDDPEGWVGEERWGWVLQLGALVEGVGESLKGEAEGAWGVVTEREGSKGEEV